MRHPKLLRSLYLAGGALLVLILAVAVYTTIVPPTGNYSSLPSVSRSLMYFGGDAGVVSKGLAVSEEMAVANDMIGLPPIAPPSAGQTAAEVDQKIIKTGNLSLVVDNVSQTASKLSEIATSKQGFLQYSSVNKRDDGTHYGNVTLRVPTKNFEAAMAEIKALANLVENESLGGQDVTEQYTDLEARLKSAQAQEATYLKILDRAQSVEDVLNVERELGNIRMQIESLQGQLKYLGNQTDYSTITVNLSEEPTIIVAESKFRPITSLKEAAHALVEIGKAAVTTAIWFVVIGGGLFLPLGLLVWLIVIVIRKIWRKKNVG
jgi:hypothetical protein